jgi:hypothetical protein
LMMHHGEHTEHKGSLAVQGTHMLSHQSAHTHMFLDQCGVVRSEDFGEKPSWPCSTKAFWEAYMGVFMIVVLHFFFSFRITVVLGAKLCQFLCGFGISEPFFCRITVSQSENCIPIAALTSFWPLQGWQRKKRQRTRDLRSTSKMRMRG